MSNKMLSINADVKQALEQGKPVVALESTIITHGMPYPTNRETAEAVEQAVIDAGAVPATIAILKGSPTIGLTRDQLDMLARTSTAMKLSRADIAMAVARGVDGSTTVAATMILAHLAGIRVFATGGIGGVHQGAETSFDISADLHELEKTPVCVVCAGAKAILDIPKTLEVLETLGVPVMAYGQDNFPAFWSCDSGIAAPLRVDNVEQISTFLNARRSLGIEGGVLIGNPVPPEDEIPSSIMQGYIRQAIGEADNQAISGKALTPWLLGRIVELSDGASLKCNQSLIINNASLAARLACALS